MRDVLDAVVGRKAASAGDRDVLVGASGFTGQAKHRVAMFEQALRGRVHDLLGKRVEHRRAGGAQHGKGDPLADHRNMSGGEYRPDSFFQPGEVGGHLVGVVAGTGSVGPGDQDEQRSVSHEPYDTCKNVQQHEGVGMLAAERRDFLLARLSTDGKIVAKEIAGQLGLSEDSVRRDLRELASAGLCQRVYGGALPASPAIADYGARVGVEPASKARIAAAVAGMIAPGSSVILDGGTTTLAVVAALPRDLDCTVITHSPTIAAALVTHPSVEVYLLGGKLFKHSAVTCGAAAAEAAHGISADVFFLGVTAVHPDEGLTTGDADEAAMKRTLADRAGETYVLASVEKIGAASRYQVLPLSAVAGIITDAEPNNSTRSLHDRGVQLIHVP